MSQFSYKYYRHNYTKNEKQGMGKHTFDDSKWTFWRIWGLYEWLTLLALLAIAFLLFTLLSGKQGSMSISEPSYSPSPTYKKDNTKNHTVKQQTVGNNALPTALTVSENKKGLEKKKNTSVYHYPKKVLPATLLPAKSMSLNDQLMHGPVSIEEYLYFVRESGVPYPYFIDSRTDDLIVEKAPECYTLDCPIYGMESLHKKFYALWLSNESGKKLEVIPDREDIMLRDSNCTL